ncbi:hypothetical protein ACFQ6C_25965 [Streptomyces sp. NPDC056454]|uniref:hypothetical protein n=1 Tax=Streptomyces sp. NPDC056454 TaxID=3345823 RepID=UPI0036BD1D2E
MDFTSLLWEETGRDIDAERTELARTAALTDASALVGPLLFQAASQEDFGHRLALVQPHLRAISAKRGYPVEELAGDLTQRYELLREADQGRQEKQAERRAVTAAQEAHMDAHVAQLAARAARENPQVPMSECLRLATEAVKKHADAYPLAYESWGGTGDGPITERAKNFTPPALPGSGSGPSSPAATSPAAAAAPDDNPLRGFDDAAASLRPRWDALTGSSALRADAAWDWGKPFRQVRDHLTDRWNEATGDPTLRKSDEDWDHDHGQWSHNLDRAQHEMSQKWDANAAAPGASPEHQHTHDLLHGFDQARAEMDKKWDANAAAPGASPGYHRPVPEAHFSHPDTSTGGGQQHLPTAATPTFSHPSVPDAAGGHNSGTEPIPSYFQHGVH